MFNSHPLNLRVINVTLKASLRRSHFSSECYLFSVPLWKSGKCRKTANVSSYGSIASADISLLSFVVKWNPRFFIIEGQF